MLKREFDTRLKMTNNYIKCDVLISEGIAARGVRRTGPNYCCRYFSTVTHSLLSFCYDDDYKCSSKIVNINDDINLKN